MKEPMDFVARIVNHEKPIYSLLFIWSALPTTFVGRGIRLPKTEKKWHVQARCLTLLEIIQRCANGRPDRHQRASHGIRGI